MLAVDAVAAELDARLHAAAVLAVDAVAVELDARLDGEAKIMGWHVLLVQRHKAQR